MDSASAPHPDGVALPDLRIRASSKIPTFFRDRGAPIYPRASVAPPPSFRYSRLHERVPAQAVVRRLGFGYDHDASEDAWGRILRFFDTHLRAA